MGSNPDARRLADRLVDQSGHLMDPTSPATVPQDRDVVRGAAESLRLALEGLLEASRPIIVESALDPDGSNRVAVALRLLSIETIWLTGGLLRDRKALTAAGLHAMRDLGILSVEEASAFTDWQEANAAVARYPADFVVVIDRPELIDGMATYETMTEVAASWPHMRLVLITGSPPPDHETKGFARLKLRHRGLVGAAFGVHDPMNREAIVAGPVGIHALTHRDFARQVRDQADDIARDVSAGDFVGAYRRLWSVDLATVDDPEVAGMLISAMSGAAETDPQIKPEWIAQRIVLELLHGSGATKRTRQIFRALTENPTAPTALDTASLAIALANVVGRMAEGNYPAAREAGAATAVALLSAPWNHLRSLGLLPGLFWACAAAAEFFGGDLTASEVLASSALGWGQSTSSRVTQLMALATLANYHAFKGNVEHVSALLEDARALRRESSWPTSDNLYREFLARFCLARFTIDHTALVEILQGIDSISEPLPSLAFIREICVCFTTLLGGDEGEALDAAAHLMTVSSGQEGHVRLRRLATQVVFDVLHSISQSDERKSMLAGLLDSSRAEGCQLGKVLILDEPDPASIITGTEACVTLQAHHSRPDLTALLLARAAAYHQLGDDHNAQLTIREAVAEGALKFPISFLYVPEHLVIPLLELAPEVDRGSVRRLLNSLGRIGRRPDADSAGTLSVLSRRERGILASLESGGTLDDIARDSFLSRNTVKSHVRAIYRKLGVSTRDEAISVLRDSRADAKVAGRANSPRGRGQGPASGVSTDPSLLI